MTAPTPGTRTRAHPAHTEFTSVRQIQDARRSAWGLQQATKALQSEVAAITSPAALPPAFKKQALAELAKAAEAAQAIVAWLAPAKEGRG
jgi:hypothetical protein